jgi:hypothetical protein
MQSFTYSDCIEVGPSGGRGGMLPFKGRELNDLVAHDDERVRYFPTSPDETLWGRRDGPDGTRILNHRLTGVARGFARNAFARGI